MTKFYKLIAITLVVVSIVLNPIYALAYNSDYLTDDKWYSSTHAAASNINIKSGSNTLNGSLKYFFDPVDSCFYINAFVSEPSISNDTQSIQFTYFIENDYESYTLIADKNGLIDCQQPNMYSTVQAFNTYPNNKNGSYIIALDINNGYAVNSISVWMGVNGTRYLIIENFIADSNEIIDEDNVIDDNEYNVNANQQNGSNINSNNTSTKYYNNSATYAGEHYNVVTNSEPIVDDSNSSSVTIINDAFDKSRVRMAKPAIILLIIAVIVALIGFAFLFRGMSGQKDDEDSDNEENNDSNHKNVDNDED